MEYLDIDGNPFSEEKLKEMFQRSFGSVSTEKQKVEIRSPKRGRSDKDEVEDASPDQDEEQELNKEGQEKEEVKTKKRKTSLKS